jgi:hypothetical protein
LSAVQTGVSVNQTCQRGRSARSAVK